ncbi:MAG: response regulator [Acidobacteria bacterium]|nr:response regulator [Acidobacteriota bacterium]
MPGLPPLKSEPGSNTLSVSFGAPNYLASHRLKFRHRLEGGAEWVETSESEVTFPNLPPGAHRLEVQARGRWGGWSNPSAVLEFSVGEPWWSSLPFRISIGGVAVAAGITFALARSRRARRERARLEKAVADRTAQLREQRERAEQASRIKSEFLANMSHEIRTPMNGILGMTNLAIESEKDPVQREQLQVVRDSAEQLMTILNDILDISKIEAGRMEIRLANFSPRQLAADVRRTLLARAAEKGLNFDCMFGAELPQAALGDDTRIRQVLLNLAGNAIKFTDSGEVRISLERRDESLYFAVADTGIGIPQASQRAIFDAFRQVDNSSSRRFGGTGLGLAICRQLVSLMGGRIGVESAAGQGSTFWFTVPYVPGEAVAAAPPPQVLSNRAAPMRLLVAEDNVVNQALILRLLEKLGHQPRIVPDGAAALAALQEPNAAYDAVLMDIQMPIMDGLEATRRYRAAGGRLPIIAMTAHAMAGDRETCLAAGMTGYLTKPVSVTLLEEMLARYSAP